jgi:hypothetical protein
MSAGTILLMIITVTSFYFIGKWLDSEPEKKSKTDTSAQSFVSGIIGILIVVGFFWLLFIPNGICESACVKDFDFPIGSERCDSTYGSCPEQDWER